MCGKTMKAIIEDSKRDWKMVRLDKDEWNKKSS